jgi:hypothetical protein
MKLCKDCAHFLSKDEKCGRSQASPDYVYGNPPRNYSAQTERESHLEEDCGPEAQWFQVLKITEAA